MVAGKRVCASCLDVWRKKLQRKNRISNLTSLILHSVVHNLDLFTSFLSRMRKMSSLPPDSAEIVNYVQGIEKQRKHCTYFVKKICYIDVEYVQIPQKLLIWS